MGYDFHITRADDWTESDSQPITLDEWIAYVRADPDLEITGVAEVTTPTGDVIRIEAEGLAVWNMPRDRRCWFDYRGGRIVVKNPDDAVIAKMQQIAGKLGAKVQGDEGELYE